MDITSINKQALEQIYFILESFSEDKKSKIPNSLINTINANMDKQYKNTSELLIETKEILYAILNKYILSQSQKEKLAEYYRYYDYKMEEEKIKKYPSEALFKKNISEIKQAMINERVEKVSLIKYKENVFIRFLNYIKNKVIKKL